MPGGMVKNFGNVHYNRSKDDLDRVVDALKEDASIFQIAVTSSDGTRIPLDRYLANVRYVGEVDNFFTGAPFFDIWRTLPYGLREYPGFFNLHPNKAQELLERFNAYTWNEQEPGVRERYMRALRTADFVADRNIGGWSALYHGPAGLSTAISRLIHSPQLTGLHSLGKLDEENERLSELNREICKMPPERLLDIFTSAGRKRINEREQISSKYQPLIKEKAKQIIEPLSRVGDEYRHRFISRFYPDYVQMRLPFDYYPLIN